METTIEAHPTKPSLTSSQPKQQVEMISCFDCKTELPHVTPQQVYGLEPSEILCKACFRLIDEDRQKNEFLGGLDSWSEKQLALAGMYPREIKAEFDLIPDGIKKVLPKAKEGEILPRGFGLSSDVTGAGKTMAMAAMFKKAFKKWAVDRWSPHKQLGCWLVWSSWPEFVSWARMNALHPEFQDRVESIKKANVLFLDDLGSERIKGSYVEDFAASQLDQIIDYRWRCELPTYFTTNLDMPGLIGFYGARLVSRLCGENPLIQVSGLKDLRLGRRK